MRPIEEREAILNMYFHEGLGYKAIAKMTGLTPSTVKSLCHRYRVSHSLPPRGEAPLAKEPLKKETIRVIKPRDTNTPEARIARLEMEVELLRNFLILADEK